MTEELKYQIIAGARAYAEKNQISQNDVAKMSKINVGYISSMFRGLIETTVDNKAVPIGEKWFYKLAEWAGFSIKKQYWEPVQTPQLAQIIHALEVARKQTKVAVLITDTGYGKTYTIDRYCKRNPMHTYKITVSSVHKLADVLRELCEQLGAHFGYSNAARLSAINHRVRELKQSGNSVQIIIDEAENLKLPVLQMLKGLYDGVNDYASLVLIGTDQLTTGLERMRRKNKEGVPQFYRRIKAGIRKINSLPDFTPFYEKYKVDKGLRKLLDSLCENYGELHDYLEPALREADETEVPLTENFFRILNDMPKYN